MSNPFSIFPTRASTIAGEVDALILTLIAITVFFAVLVSALCLIFAVRYRRRQANEQPVQIEGNLKLELAWTIIPLVIAMVTFFWGTHVFLKIFTRPPDATPIYVVGKQWMWKLQHPDGRREINELHVPVGAKFRLVMTSEDVIHSFFIPAFRVKIDVVPGRYSGTWFEATQEGVYHLFCTQYCGTDHSAMRGRVVVMSPAAYEEWLSGQIAGSAPVPMAELGARLFTEKACVTCHAGLPGQLGPPLAGVFGHKVTLANGQDVLIDEAYIRESILKPQAKMVKGFQPVMPTFEGQITEEQILQLIAYIKSLKPAAPAGGKP